MTDTPDKPEDQESEPLQLDEEEPRLREVSRDELMRILEAHKKWVESDGKEGERADLANANLHHAYLDGANLRGARLNSVNFQEAHLTVANLREADLGGANLLKAGLFAANLQGANLRSANIQKAYLRDTIFREADLSNADLTGTTDIVGDNFGGAKLTNAKLPDHIAKFEGLGHVEETSKNARKIFLAMLLGCAYAWLTIATTTDARVLTNSASSPLPIIGTEIPIAWFYWAAPLVLIGLYVYLHFYLERLWHGLAGLPARFPDGKRLDERAYPWLLNGLVRRHFALLRKYRPLIARFEELVTIFLAWWAVPVTLLGFWVRYLPRHEWVGTGLHILLIVASVALALIFYHSAARTLRGEERQPFRWKSLWRDRRAYQSVATVFVGSVLLVLSYGAIDGVRAHNPDLTDVRILVPWTFDRVGYSTFAKFREEDVSTRPANYWQLSPEDRNKSVKGASLDGRNLRYADAVQAFLANADLRHADLQGANLGSTNLQGANLRHANLVDANLISAKLEEADLFGANLQGANLIAAKLEEADLRFAALEGASLLIANLDGTNLTGAKGLTQKQLDQACGDADTKLPPGLTIKPCQEAGE